MANEKYTITIEGKRIWENQTKKGVVQKITSYIFGNNTFEYVQKEAFFNYYKDTMRAIISKEEYEAEMKVILSKPKKEQREKHFEEEFCFGGSKWHFSCDKWPGQGTSPKPKNEKFKPFVQKVKELFPCIDITSESIESKESPTTAIPSEENTPSSENAKKKHKEESLKIALLVGEPKNDDEIKKLKDEILTGIDTDWCNKLQFCQSLKFTDKKEMKVDLSMKNIVDSLVKDNAFFPQEIRGILEKRYKTMTVNCTAKQSKENWDDKENNLNIEDLNAFPDALLGIPEKNYFTSDFWTNFFTKYNNIGHDMPVWLYYENITEFPKLEDRPRVMIVSQDPLRNNHDEDKVYLSTPFGFHSLDYLQTEDDETKKSMVRMFVHLYLRQGYIVYLTDVMKLFGYDRASAKKLNELKKEEPHKTAYNTILKKSIVILKKEIEYFKPDFIVSLGEPVAEALTGAWNDKKNDHRNRVVPLLDELCYDRQHAPSVYVRYHTNAHSDANLHFNDPEYWYVKPNEEQTSAGDQDNDISKQGDEQ